MRGGRRGGLLVEQGPRVALLLSVLILLLAFQHVVRGAVDNGELMRQADARHAEASWRCRILPAPEERATCLAGLGPAR